jgi:hypothetical protein
VALTIDPEIFFILSERGPLGQPGPPVGDVETRRRQSVEAFAAMAGLP